MISQQINRFYSAIESSEISFCRNLNQIRSTIRDHGNLIDRHTIMARRLVSRYFSSNIRFGCFSAILGARKHERPRQLFKDRAYARLELFFFDLILL